MLQHGDAFQSHAESEATVNLWVISPVGQHFGMYHAGAQDLHPTGVLADPAALAAADDAVHVGFRAGFGEGEVICAKAKLAIRAKHAPGEVHQCPLEISQGDVFSYGKPFDVVEHELSASRHLFEAVGSSWKNHSDGLWTEPTHGMNLPG